MTEIHGTVVPGWESASEAFAANFEKDLELGASFYMTHQGKPVVDIWAGDADPHGTPWAEDTMVNVYSTTKTMTFIAIMMLVDRGQLDVHEKVATYWPEFAQNGKENVTIAEVMSHRAGIPGFDPSIRTEDLYDWDAVVAQLAGQTPWLEPGGDSAYHAVTQGFLLGEIVRRIDGRSFGTFFREEIAGPLGADFHVGFGPEHDAKCGELIPPEIDMSEAAFAAAGMPADSLAARTMTSVPITAREPQTRAWRAAEIPAAGGFGNARSVGRIHSALACGGSVDGVTLMSPETLEMITETQSHGTDGVLLLDMHFGLGFGLTSETVPLPNNRTIYWGGYGGSLAVIDLENQLTFTYVMNRMDAGLAADERGMSLVLAGYLAAMTAAVG
ncbi:MAG: serine hydrolase domain-containing protein [Acidimicrobiales bacterium]